MYLADVPLDPFQGFSLVLQTIVCASVFGFSDFLAGDEPVRPDAVMRADDDDIAL